MPLQDVFDAMPPVFREQVEGYIRFVGSVADELFIDHNRRRPSDSQRQVFLTLAAAWKIWQSVESQYWLVVNSLALLRTSGVDEVAVGGGRYSSTSGQFDTLVTLRSALLDLFRDAGLEDLPAVDRVGDLVERSLDTAS